MDQDAISSRIKRPQFFRWTAGKAKLFRNILHGLGRSLVLAVALPCAWAYAWTQIPGSGFVTSVTVMPNGTILGVGTDKSLWTRATLSSEWQQVPLSGSVTSVAVMPNGKILGVGTDKFLWTRDKLNAEWTQVPNSAAVTSVAVMPNGTILGVGTDKFLWTRPTLNAAWTQVPNSAAVTSVAVMSNGTILGVGVDNTLWTRAQPDIAVASGAATSPTKPHDSAVGCSNCPPWVSQSFKGNYLPLAAQAEIWSDPKPFKGVDDRLSVQSRFMGQKGTTCRFEVQFNNVLDKAIDEQIVLSRPGKAAVSKYDTVLRAKLKPRTSVAFGTELRECPLNWGETKDMEKCAACEPTVYFYAQ